MGRLGPAAFATAMYASMVLWHSEGMKEDVLGVDDDGAGVAIAVAVAYRARSGQQPFPAVLFARVADE